MDKSNMKDDKRPSTRVACIALLTLAMVSVIVRCYTRIFINKSFGWDDGFMVAASVFMVLFIVFIFLTAEHSLGIHYQYLTSEDVKWGSFYFFLDYIWYALTMMFSKISICIYLLRIVVTRRDIWILYAIMASTVITAVIFVFICIFQCKPVALFWDKTLKGTCINPNVIKNYVFFWSAVSVVCDFTCAILPMYLIWKLNMTLRTKLALIPIMLMACVASAGVCVRFVYLPQYGSMDFFYTLADIIIWSVVEAGLAITAGSLATLRPLMVKLAQKLGLTRSGGHSSLEGSERNDNGASRYFRSNTKVGSRNKPSTLYDLETFADHGKNDAGEANSTSELRIT